MYIKRSLFEHGGFKILKNYSEKVQLLFLFSFCFCFLCLLFCLEILLIFPPGVPKFVKYLKITVINVVLWLEKSHQTCRNRFFSNDRYKLNKHLSKIFFNIFILSTITTSFGVTFLNNEKKYELNFVNCCGWSQREKKPATHFIIRKFFSALFFQWKYFLWLKQQAPS